MHRVLIFVLVQRNKVMVSKLARFLPLYGLSYMGQITGTDVDTMTYILIDSKGCSCEEEDYISCSPYINLGAAISVQSELTWSHCYKSQGKRHNSPVICLAGVDDNKIAVNAAARRDVRDIASIFRAKAVDVSNHTINLEVVQDVSPPLPFYLPMVPIKHPEACSTAEAYKLAVGKR